SSAEPEGVVQPQITGFGASSYDGGKPAVDTLTITGPYAAASVGDTASRRAVFVCRPQSSAGADEARCAREIVSHLARRAYRRPVKESDLRTLLAFYEEGRAAGGFEAGIRRALERVLVDAEFLFRIERDPSGAAPGSSYRLSDLELASRLSFFIWG